MPDTPEQTPDRPQREGDEGTPSTDAIRGQVTQLLSAASGGDPSALERALPLIYEDLRRQADRFLRRERSDHTLQATALVHEAWLRLAQQHSAQWQNRSHFLAVAATAMRRILVNHARERGRIKRGRGRHRVDLDDAAMVADEPEIDLIALDDAMDRLARLEPRLVRTVELRYFGGLSVEETAEVLEVGTATVKRDWAFARAWLRKELEAADAGDASDVATR